MVGVEPTSKNISERLSPSTVNAFCFAKLTVTLTHCDFAIPLNSPALPESHATVSCINDTNFKPAGEPELMRGAELCSQCEIVVIFSVCI